jgi:hypothetical protein
MALAYQEGIGEELMVWLALVLAVVALPLAAVAITVGYTARRQITSLNGTLSWSAAELQRRDEAVTSLQSDVSISSKKLEFAEAQLKESRKDLDKAVMTSRQQAEQLITMSRRADAHFITADVDAVEATALVTELERYAVGSLEQAAAGARPRILRGGLYAQRPVLDLVPDLVDGFLTALNAGLMYRQADPPDGSRFYLRWPGSLPSPEILLDTLLKAAAVPAQPGEPTGAAELRILLHAMHAGSPAILFIGPLLIERGGPDGPDLSAGIAPPPWNGPSDEQKEAALVGNDPPFITQAGASEVVHWPTPTEQTA